jgi:RNA polymerase sigma-70 factor (ECF subfamily)
MYRTALATPIVFHDPDFDLDLRTILPRLRLYALSLTRNGERAHELVRQTVLKALAGRQSCRAGTNFTGWIFRIEFSEFISQLQRSRPPAGLDNTRRKQVRTIAEQ